MPNLNEVIKLLPVPKYSDQLSVKNQSTKDIINQVMQQHLQNKSDAKKIAYLFDGGDIKNTSQNIWNFLKQYVPYHVEPSDKQTTKTLSRMLYDAKKNIGSDRKHYSGFTASILDALGYKNWCFRFAGYSKYISVPTHVYVVCNDSGNMVFVDAVLSYFDVEKPYVLKVDKKIKKDMSLYKLSGVDEIGQDPNDVAMVGGLGKWLKKTVQKGFDVINKNVPVLKKIADVTGDVARKVKESAFTVGLAIPRNAFLLLIKFNVKGWATGLRNSTFDDLVWWRDYFGGNRTELMEAIKKGAKNKRIFGFADNDILDPKAVGMIGEPVTIASALATASPIMIKVTSFLEKAQKVADKVEGVTSKINDTANTIKNAQATFEQTTGIPITNILFKKQEGQTGTANQLSQSDFQRPTEAEAEKVASAFVKQEAKKQPGGGFKISNKMLLIGGGIILAGGLIYYATRNKQQQSTTII
jgi:hypothetical protein